MFCITQGKGFHMAFPNGYRVSVQWGPDNYCSNRDSKMSKEDTGSAGSYTAECAVFNDIGDYVRAPWMTDDVIGWQYPEEVLRLMNWAANQQPVAQA